MAKTNTNKGEEKKGSGKKGAGKKGTGKKGSAKKKSTARKTIFGMLGFILFVGAAVLAYVGVTYYNVHKKANFSKDYMLYVYPDMTQDQIIDSLAVGAGMMDRKSMERAFKVEETYGPVLPGKYKVSAKDPSIYVARMVTRGWQTPQMLTLSGTMRNKGVIAKKISNQMMVDSAAVASALNDEEFLAGYGFTPAEVYGMILPDTYEMYWTASVEEIFDRLKKEYDEFWTPERIEKAKAQKLTQKQVSVVASIVSGETLKDFEYPIIAGVYLNRFRKGMKLQADPTVCFCHDYKLDRVLKKHLTIDSPYNTYKYAGLPPAPINVPPKACIDAVLNPDTHGYIYFCASAAFDGTHKFAVGYTEHMKNAREFQKALTKRNKEKKAAAK